MNTNKFDKNHYICNTDSKIGVYLVHGFSSTTYEMKMLFDFLEKKKYYVVCKNLPGHGTTVDDCNRQKFSDWLKFSEIEFAKLASKVDQIFIIGSSMGGVISLYLASMFPVNGVIVGGTVFQFKKPFMTFLGSVLSKILKYENKRNMFPKDVRDKIEFYGYSQYPLVALSEFRKMNKLVKRKMNNMNAPILIIHSNSDRTSVKENVNIIKNNISSQDKKVLIVNDAHHNMFDENVDQKLIFENVSDFILSHLNIKSK
ncbi:MAG: hypothetical protein CMG64_03600 [Candidatus Marinimicrobia bacterium]|nr:hypothetical protein [Candidatus Neomarinimicrobiota bacterium]|tara:strand:- start:11889 stop:12659 length:771 start_codon:yes stop_codon:yes gene_type:complete